MNCIDMQGRKRCHKFKMDESGVFCQLSGTKKWEHVDPDAENNLRTKIKEWNEKRKK